MGNRTGTYVAFHAEGTNVPIQTDMKYYHMLEAWHDNRNIDFTITNSHDKTYAVRDSSSRATLEARLKERLNVSKNMVLIVGARTRYDTDWIPFEISYAVDSCKMPIIVAYPDLDFVVDPSALRFLWPDALARRLDGHLASTIHIPFKLAPMKDAIDTWTVNNLPPYTNTYYEASAYRAWGLLS